MSPPRKASQPQGSPPPPPRPPSLKVSRKSNKIKKRPPGPPSQNAPAGTSHQQREPAIIYDNPRTINVNSEADFKNVVQRLTGKPPGEEPPVIAGDASQAPIEISDTEDGDETQKLEEGLETSQCIDELFSEIDTLPSVPPSEVVTTAGETQTASSFLSNQPGFSSAAANSFLPGPPDCFPTAPGAAAGSFLPNPPSFPPAGASSYLPDRSSVYPVPASWHYLSTKGYFQDSAADASTFLPPYPPGFPPAPGRSFLARQPPISPATAPSNYFPSSPDFSSPAATGSFWQSMPEFSPATASTYIPSPPDFSPTAGRGFLLRPPEFSPAASSYLLTPGISPAAASSSLPSPPDFSSTAASSYFPPEYYDGQAYPQAPQRSPEQSD